MSETAADPKLYGQDDYEGALSDISSLLDVLIRRINGEADLASAAEWVRLNYPMAAERIKTAARDPHVFLDCDGVLADFDAHGLEYFGMPPREAEKQLGAKEFWRQLEARGDFYRSMPLMVDAMVLYEGVKHLSPTILTGCPKGDWAQGQKVAWAAEHFPGVPIITCRSADKRDYAKPGDVLIDDWPRHRHRWIEMGGHFIVHHDAESSIAALWAHYPHLKPLEQPS